MKKTVLFSLAVLALAASANAQYYHYYSSKPWDGNKSYSLNVGTSMDLAPRNFGDDATNVQSTPGLAASFRYEGDKNINERFSWGYQAELSYLAQNLNFDKPGLEEVGTTLQTVDKHFDLNRWDGVFDVRLSLSYWFGDSFELQAAAGIYACLVYGYKGQSYRLNADGSEMANTRKNVDPVVDIFTFDMGVSTMLQAKYFFNDNVFLSLSLHDNIGLDIFKTSTTFDNNINGKGGQHGIALVGIGYKVIR